MSAPAVPGAIYPHNEVWDALREVPDPEMAISIVDMGLVVMARREGDTAYITLTYTAMGCPAMDMIEEDARVALLRVPGIHNVQFETVWEPVWTKARLTEDARDALLTFGVAL